MRFLAVDIGGSKIDILYYGNENIAYRRLNLGLKHRDLEDSEFMKRFHRIVNIALGYDADRYIFSVAGLDSKYDWMFWRNLLSSKFDKKRYLLIHDVVSVLYSGTLGGDGIAIIIGTGCNVYAEYMGNKIYSGNWGWRFGDDFSGYRLSRDFINIILRMYDGRIDRSEIYYKFLREYGIDEEDLIPYIYELKVEDVAKISIFLCKSYLDPIVNRLFNNLIREAYIALETVVRKTSRELSIHYTGGLFECTRFREDFMRYISSMGLRLGEYVKYPVVGALIAGLKHEGFKTDDISKIKNDVLEYFGR